MSSKLKRECFGFFVAKVGDVNGASFDAQGAVTFYFANLSPLDFLSAERVSLIVGVSQ